MSFETISHKIISESINSALYIDDKVLLPFEEPSGSYIDQGSLFKSFNANNCLIDFRRYDNQAPFNVEKALYNKDLLILDWHLNANDEGNLSATFNILDKAIQASNLHFAVIYTAQNKEVLSQKVILQIASYYSGLNKQMTSDCKKFYEALIEETGLSDNDAESFSAKLSSLAVELFFEFANREQNKAISKDVRGLLDAYKLKDSFEEFLAKQNLPKDTFKERLVCLGFILSNCEVPELGKNYEIKVSADRGTIKVKNLYLKVFSKEIEDAALYRAFTKSLVEESNIFLTLLGLEIRNRFRETSAFIGKDLDEVDQLAFFFHRKGHFDGNAELFNDFLKDIWRDQVASFLFEKEIELFSIIDEYATIIDLEKKLSKFIYSDGTSRLAIAKLNLVYNKLTVKRKENDEIRFGDIFYFDTDKGQRIYLLCLTQNCDCLRPGKIKNMFFFVEGTDIGIATGVKKSDGDFISFIQKTDGELTCIDWTNATDDCKPFSLHIANNRMVSSDMKISFGFLGIEKEASYLCTIKENYAQRISNKAFSYPLRVAIDFASFKHEA